MLYILSNNQKPDDIQKTSLKIVYHVFYRYPQSVNISLMNRYLES